jgi:hypothetical protein
MILRSAKLSINRSSVNRDQSRFWFHIPRKTPTKISFPREAPMVDLGCPCLVVTPWTPCGSNGENRRGRAVGALASFLSHLSGKRRSKCAHRPEARRRRYSPFPPRTSTRVTIKGGFVCSGFAAAATLHAIVRASLSPIPHSVDAAQSRDSAATRNLQDRNGRCARNVATERRSP